MKIGIFDSGIGGITVLYEALKMLPKEDYIYYADTLNAPYGTKPKDEVREYIINAAEFIKSKGVKALVVACNTATSVAINELRSLYSFPIIGMEPAVKPAVEKSRNINKRVLVTATPLTVKEEKLKNLIEMVDNEHIVDLLPLPGLVEFAESDEFRKEIVVPYLKKELSRFDIEEYGTIVLGCTHFPLFRDSFRKVLPSDTDIIDGSRGTVKNLKRKLDEMGKTNEGSGKIEFYISGNEVKEETTLTRYHKLIDRMSEI